MNNQWFSKVAVWLVIALVLFTVFKQFDRGATQGAQVVGAAIRTARVAGRSASESATRSRSPDRSQSLRPRRRRRHGRRPHPRR